MPSTTNLSNKPRLRFLRSEPNPQIPRYRYRASQIKPSQLNRFFKIGVVISRPPALLLFLPAQPPQTHNKIPECECGCACEEAPLLHTTPFLPYLEIGAQTVHHPSFSSHLPCSLPSPYTDPPPARAQPNFSSTVALYLTLPYLTSPFPLAFALQDSSGSPCKYLHVLRLASDQISYLHSRSTSQVLLN
jgi:hypothetical protein